MGFNVSAHFCFSNAGKGDTVRKLPGLHSYFRENQPFFNFIGRSRGQLESRGERKYFPRNLPKSGFSIYRKRSQAFFRALWFSFKGEETGGKIGKDF
jgi:hypothetical protein